MKSADYASTRHCASKKTYRTSLRERDKQSFRSWNNQHRLGHVERMHCIQSYECRVSDPVSCIPKIPTVPTHLSHRSSLHVYLMDSGGNLRESNCANADSHADRRQLFTSKHLGIISGSWDLHGQHVLMTFTWPRAEIESHRSLAS